MSETTFVYTETPGDPSFDAKAEALKGREQARKSELIKNFRLEADYKDTLRKQELQRKIESIDLSDDDPGTLAKLNEQHNLLVEALKSKLTFINSSLTEVTPLYYGNIVLIGAQTGHGKSTTSANITETLVKQGKRVLVITNEEVMLDVYNRIACLMLGFHYAELENFSDDANAQLALKRAEIIKQVQVVDAEHRDIPNITTSIEGVRKVLESLITKNSHFDCIIIDYYQNVSYSTDNPKKSKWEVLADFSNYLDDFRKRYKAPIVLFAQLHPTSKTKDQVEFESRVKEGKSICMKATFIWEITPDYDEGNTVWRWWKKRNMKGTEPDTITTPFKAGRYCEPVFDLIMDAEGEIIEPAKETTNA
jgi:KaiC/GvpD/RAD55 family RecA-like ATPase